MVQAKINPEVIALLENVLLTVVRAIVHHPEDVCVNIIPASYRLLAELHTHPEDVGQVVGKNGYVATAIRGLVAAISGNHNIRMDYDYVTEKNHMA